ncbi:MAG TPA: hypothetical protein DCK76_12315 [Desulfotomaculum sp.]|nr:hypothetical protein [Desulfotomaculum sp.]HBY02958.1 hypothetical protein [Desulfotomaculum sp.]
MSAGFSRARYSRFPGRIPGEIRKIRNPWSFGEQVENSARKAIKLRYQMLPYFYSLLYGTTQNGQLIMRPIFYHTPTESALNPEFYETEFLIGPHLLLAPLMDTAPTRMFYLPLIT